MKFIMRFMVLFLILSAGKTFADDSPVDKVKEFAKFTKDYGSMLESKYDKFQGGTVITNKMYENYFPYELRNEKHDKVKLAPQVSAMFEGNTLTKAPDTVTVRFIHFSDQDKDYEAAHKVILLVDGKKLVLPAETYAVVKPQLSAWQETIELTLPFKQFLQIANASTVEGEVNTTDFVFEDIDFWLFQELAKMVTPPPAAVAATPDAK